MVFFFLFFLFFLISIASTVFWIWMLIDSATNKRLTDNQKIVWVLVVLFTHLIGAILYFCIARSAQPTQNFYQPYGQQQPQATYNPYYQPSQQGYAPQPPYQQGYPMPPQNQTGYAPPPPYQQGYPSAPGTPYQGYQAPAAPYQQGYQQQQGYPGGSPPPQQPPRNAIPPTPSQVDYEQPQAMYPHQPEQEQEQGYD